MVISKVVIRRLSSVNGHVGFASCVIDDWLYLNNIAIFLRLNSDKIRLVFPEKKIGENKISLFHPLTTEKYFELEQKILENFKNI